MKEITIKLSFSELHIVVLRLGEDYQITFWGGDSPHIGCTALAVPRPSLRNDGSRSATSSVLNVTGHKDEQIARRLAEKAAISENAAAVCSGGFHAKQITAEQIEEVLEAVEHVVL